MSGTAIYRFLRLQPTASTEEIRKAFERRALETHPDQNPGDPQAAEQFARVKRAYDLLSDEGRRRKWHRDHGLPWIWGASTEQAPSEDLPPEELDWACVACHGEVAYRCAVCRVGLCGHNTFMVGAAGFLQPVCANCKLDGDDDRRLKWKLRHMFRGKP